MIDKMFLQRPDVKYSYLLVQGWEKPKFLHCFT